MQTRSEWTQVRTAGAAWFRSDKCVLARRLAAYATAGIPLQLGLIADYPEKPIGLRHAGRDRAVGRLIDSLEGGHSLSEAMAAAGRFFKPEDVAFVRAGEETGSLPEALEGWHSSLAARHRLLAGGVGALAYPLGVCTIAVAVMAVVTWQVLPTFAKMCAQQGIELPLLTRVVVSAGSPPRLAVMLLLALAMVVSVIAVGRQYPRLQRGLSRLADALPVLGALRLGQARKSVLDVLACQLRAGRTVPVALRAAAAVLKSPGQRQDLVSQAEHLEGGAELTEGGRGQVLDARTAWAVNQALRTRDPAASMASLARRAMRDEELKLSRVLVVMEPVAVVLLSLLVGACVVASYLPLFLSRSLVP